MKRIVFFALFQLFTHTVCFTNQSSAQSFEPLFYDIGAPLVSDVWVDPANGNDGRSGATREQSLRSLAEAWRRIPQATPLTRGYRIRLTAGEFTELPNYWESRWGTRSAPIIIEGADGPGTSVLRNGPNVFDTRYLYFINLSIVPNPAGDAFHCEQCDHTLLRGLYLNGGDARQAQETIKVNQSRHFYIETSDISGAHDNTIDFVSVQYGHVLRNRIHNAEDWCIYSKGGSAYIRVEGNEIFNCGTGGYTAGQGSGFEFIDSPWLHYEAYDIKVINNIIHDTDGAALGVNGGYNILLAFNTMYRVGRRSHGIEVVFGARSCDGMTAQCQARVAAGGWGTSTPGDTVPIPNRNVFIYNNVLFNPAGFQSTWQHFAIYGPQATSPGSNVPSPARTDTNLQIRGNVIWNGPADLSLGLGDDSGCLPANPTCNASQLVYENRINTLQPDFQNPSQGNYLPGASLAAVAGVAIPDFSGGDREQRPLAPAGILLNAVPRDFNGNARNPSLPHVGALLPGSLPGAGAPPSVPTPPPPGEPQPPLAQPLPAPTLPPQAEPVPPVNHLGPQFLGMTLNRTQFGSRGGRVRVVVYGSQTARAYAFLLNKRNNRLVRFSLRGTRLGRSAIYAYVGNLPVPSNRGRPPERYEVLARVENRYGDFTADYGEILVQAATRRR